MIGGELNKNPGRQLAPSGELRVTVIAKIKVCFQYGGKLVRI
jgi:hypothetical protein